MKTLEEKVIDQKTIQKESIIAFACFAVFIFAAIFFWKWLHKQPESSGALKPLRTVLDANENIFGNLLSNNHTAKAFSPSAVASNVRVNGGAGMSAGFDANNWKLKVVRKPGDTLFVSLDEIRALPKTNVVFDFKCIEGWSQVTRWAGVKFSDFVAKYGLTEQSKMDYVGMVTPDQEYYVGIDKASMLHPQTILCYEMNGAPLPMNQGYPLRLIIPVKYGVKHLKRIGTISFSDERPRDYWFERGYDYFCGL